MMHRPTSRYNGPGARVARPPAAERNVRPPENAMSQPPTQDRRGHPDIEAEVTLLAIEHAGRKHPVFSGPPCQTICQRERGKVVPVRAWSFSPISCTLAKRRGSSTND